MSWTFGRSPATGEEGADDEDLKESGNFWLLVGSHLHGILDDKLLSNRRKLDVVVVALKEAIHCVFVVVLVTFLIDVPAFGTRLRVTSRASLLKMIFKALERASTLAAETRALTCSLGHLIASKPSSSLTLEVTSL